MDGLSACELPYCTPENASSATQQKADSPIIHSKILFLRFGNGVLSSTGFSRWWYTGFSWDYDSLLINGNAPPFTDKVLGEAFMGFLHMGELYFISELLLIDVANSSLLGRLTSFERVLKLYYGVKH